jgi:hypothetical protein
MTPPDELLPAGVPPASQYQPHAPAAGFRLPSMAQPIGGRQALAALHAPARPATAPAGGAPMLAHLTNGAGRFPAALPMAGSAAGGAGRPSLLQGLELDQNPQTQPPAGQAPAQATPHLQPSQPPPKPPHAIDSELLRQLAEQVQQLEGGLAKCSSSVEALTTAVMERIAHVLERLQAQQQLLQAQADAAEAAAAARSSVRLMDAACQAEAAWRADAACQTDAAPQAPVLRSPSPASQPAMGGAAEGSATRQSRRPADGDAGMLLGSGGGAPLASAAAPTTLQPPAPGQAPAGCHASPCAVQQLPPAPPPGGGGGARQGTRQQHNMVQTVLPFGGAAAQRVRVPSASKAGSRGAANGATRHSSRLASAAAAVAAAGTEPAEKRGGRAVASAANSTGGAGLLKCRRTDMPPLPASEQGKRRRDDQAGGGAQPAQKRQLSSVVQLFAPAASPSAASADARQVVGALHLSPDPPSPTAECSIGNIDNTAIARQVGSAFLLLPQSFRHAGAHVPMEGGCLVPCCQIIA